MQIFILQSFSSPPHLLHNHPIFPPGLPHSPYPPPPPSQVPLQPTITNSSELDLLKTKVQQLVKDTAAMHAELEIIKNNIIHEENQDTITGSAPTDNQEEGAGSAPIDNQEEHTESSPTQVSQGWWPWSPKTPHTSGAMGEVPEGVPTALPPDPNHQPVETGKKPDNEAVITQEEFANLISKISAIETSQQEIKTFQQKFAEGSDGRKRWAKDTEDHLEKLEKDFDIIEDWTTQEISALEIRLGSKITSIEQSLSKLEHQFKNFNLDSFITDLGETQTTVDDVQQSFKDLKLKLETIEESIADMPTALPIANDKQPPTEANDEYTVEEKCKNCKSIPCLDGESVTSENFVNDAYFKGLSMTSEPIHGYTKVNNLTHYQVKWFKFSAFPCTDFNQTQDFSENVKSLKFSCHT